jgi:hypothetical protein
MIETREEKRLQKLREAEAREATRPKPPKTTLVRQGADFWRLSLDPVIKEGR